MEQHVGGQFGLLRVPVPTAKCISSLPVLPQRVAPKLLECFVWLCAGCTIEFDVFTDKLGHGLRDGTSVLLSGRILFSFRILLQTVTFIFKVFDLLRFLLEEIILILNLRFLFNLYKVTQSVVLLVRVNLLNLTVETIKFMNLSPAALAKQTVPIFELLQGRLSWSNLLQSFRKSRNPRLFKKGDLPKQ